ncbi:MAG: sugar phosphate isomerase/epimerase [Planctomycetes bacterium]|nr:sugar phosphate isomerase/epimerase [Planctomycetota bacterium]
MKIACQYGLATGDTALEKFQNIKKWGFEGVELTPWGQIDGDRCKFALSTEKEIAAASKKTGLPVTSICGGIHFDCICADAEKRKADVERMKQMLQLAGRLGATGAIFVPIFNGNAALPDLWPIKSSVELQKDLLVAVLKEIAPIGEKCGASVILEPLNRYEAPWFNRLEQGAEICDRVKSPAVGFMADFFHMNIEETDGPAAIRKHGKWLNHVHLADNTRKQPGTGVTDFKAGFAALKSIGFKGAMAMECGIVGEHNKVMPECVKYLRACRG